MKTMTYDCLTYNGESDILEIRLNILDPHVDFFVLGQSTETFSGKEKPLYFDINDPRWDNWRDKIIEVVIPKLPLAGSFERAGFQKDYLRTALSHCKDDDIIYFSDVDEVWRPQTEEGNLKQLNYSYYLNNRSSEEWVGTIVSKYKNLRDLNEMRADHSVVLEDGGWHFTNMGGVEQILKKLASYDHVEFDTEDVRSKVAERMEKGEDYVGRGRDWQGNPFRMWWDEKHLPQYLLDNKAKWSHLFR